jgi:hypothetical protein
MKLKSAWIGKISLLLFALSGWLAPQANAQDQRPGRFSNGRLLLFKGNINSANGTFLFRPMQGVRSQLTFQFSLNTANSHNLAVTRISCTYDETIADFNTGNNAFAFTDMPFFQVLQGTISNTTYSGASVINMNGASGSATILSVPNQDCAQVAITFNMAGTPLTDVLTVWVENSINPIGSGVPGEVASVQGTAPTGANLGTTKPITVGGSDGTNGRVLLTGNAGTLRLGNSFTGADGLTNSSIEGLIVTGLSEGSAGSISALTVLPFLFNGVSWDRPFYCNKTAFVSGVSAATSQIVAAAAAQKVRICTVVIERTDTVAVATTVRLVEGTGVNCAVAQTNLTGILLATGATATTTTEPATIINNGATGAFISNVAADAVCVQTTGAASTYDVTITFEQH